MTPLVAVNRWCAPSASSQMAPVTAPDSSVCSCLQGHVVEELGAGGGQVLGDHRGGSVVVALHVEVGVGVQVDVVAVVGEHGVVGLAFHAALRRLLGPPGQGLLGVVGPDVHEVAVGAVVALPVDEAHAGLDGGLVGLGEVDGGGHVAGGLGGADILHASHARPGLKRGVHGGQARLAGADHDDVVLVGLGEIGDGLLRREERGAGSGARVGQALLGGSLGDSLGLAAAGERASSGHTERGQAAELEQVATSNSGGHGELPLFPLREVLREPSRLSLRRALLRALRFVGRRAPSLIDAVRETATAAFHRRSRTRAIFRLPPECDTPRQPSTDVRAWRPVTAPTMVAAAPSRIGKWPRKRLFS